jgi:hypothetical protein
MGSRGRTARGVGLVMAVMAVLAAVGPRGALAQARPSCARPLSARIDASLCLGRDELCGVHGAGGPL